MVEAGITGTSIYLFSAFLSIQELHSIPSFFLYLALLSAGHREGAVPLLKMESFHELMSGLTGETHHQTLPGVVNRYISCDICLKISLPELKSEVNIYQGSLEKTTDLHNSGGPDVNSHFGGRTPFTIFAIAT